MNILVSLPVTQLHFPVVCVRCRFPLMGLHYSAGLAQQQCPTFLPISSLQLNARLNYQTFVIEICFKLLVFISDVQVLNEFLQFRPVWYTGSY